MVGEWSEFVTRNMVYCFLCVNLRISIGRETWSLIIKIWAARFNAMLMADTAHPVSRKISQSTQCGFNMYIAFTC